MKLFLRILLLVFACVAYGIFEFYRQRTTMHQSLQYSYELAGFVSGSGFIAGTAYLIWRK